MVDAGALTVSEKAELLETLEGNLKSVSDEISVASSEGKPKKVEKLEEKRQGVVKRKDVVSKITPIERRLKHGAANNQAFSLYDVNI